MSGSLRPSAGYMGRGVHVVPPEQLRAAKRGVTLLGCVPDLLARHEVIRLAPQPHLAEIAEVPAVADDPVLARQAAGDERRLDGTRDRRGDRAQWYRAAGAR